jgi:hypothetical protein
MKTYKYFTNLDGSSSKIATLSKKEVAKSISIHKRRMEAMYLILHQLHDRFHVVHPERHRPDTKKVFLKAAGLRTESPIAKGKSHPSEETMRMEAIINLCLQLLDDESDLQVIKNCLLQAKGEMKDD